MKRYHAAHTGTRSVTIHQGYADTKLTRSVVSGGRSISIYTKILCETQGLPLLTEDFPPRRAVPAEPHVLRGSAGFHARPVGGRGWGAHELQISRDCCVRVPRYFPHCRGDQRCPWGARGPAVRIPSNLH